MPVLLRRQCYATAARLGRDLKGTLHLPRTTFPLRPSASHDERAALLKRCTADLYALQSQREPSTGTSSDTDTANGTFVLHDGPPYANGELHLGHALNKILKDMINRVQVLDGKRVVFVPGWDCHGLPIELKALQSVGSSAIEPGAEVGMGAETGTGTGVGMPAEQVRSLARALAQKTIAKQRAAFQEWAVMADWERAYVTMDVDYEARQLQVFHQMLRRGLIYRKFRPVYWSPSSGSALAEAELEYDAHHASKAAFVKFPLLQPGLLDGVGTAGVAKEDDDDGGGGVSAVIWTTTPWTIPANKAIAVGAAFNYSVVASATHGRLLVASERVGPLAALLGEDLRPVRCGIAGHHLVGLRYRHPLLTRESPGSAAGLPVIATDFVTADSGTGLVHVAPGHGFDDYRACLAHGIAPFSPVDGCGRFTADAPVVELHGQQVTAEGTDTVLRLLAGAGALAHLQHRFVHRYPYDWRTGRPVIVRATAQWFADAEALKADAVAALDGVHFVPAAAQARLASFVRGRSEWCISRQRAWGVPIPVLYAVHSGEPLLTDASVAHAIATLGRLGTDAWFSRAVPDSAFVAPECQRQHPATAFVRGTDTMDVWFDSGTSWATLAARLDDAGATADLCVEGTDQHRGWFQSSLLTSVAARSRAPFRQLLTHGFVLDGRGRKMSKSLGNVISPADVTSRAPADVGRPAQPASPVTPDSPTPRPPSRPPAVDILRLWVAHTEFTRDVTISPVQLGHIHEMLRKARVTARFLLGILADYDPAASSCSPPPPPALTALDRVALAQLAAVNAAFRAAVLGHNFSRAVTLLLSAYTNTQLSAFYLDVIKDRVYASAAAAPPRRSAQFVAWHILRNYASLLAPVVPLLTQEIWTHAPPALLAAVPAAERCMLAFYSPPAHFCDAALLADFDHLLAPVHAAVRRAIEAAKAAGRVRVSLQVAADVAVGDPRLRRRLDAYRADLEQLCIVSALAVAPDAVLPRPPLGIKGGSGWEEVVGLDFGQATAEEALAGPDGHGGLVRVRAACGHKCPRCWMYTARNEGDVCGRCQTVLDHLH